MRGLVVTRGTKRHILTEEEEDDIFWPQLNTCITTMHNIACKKIKREKITHLELIQLFTQTYTLYGHNMYEKSRRAEFDQRIMGEKRFIVSTAKEYVWKNAAIMCLLLHRHKLWLPAEIWKIIVDAAISIKQTEMHQFALRLSSGTDMRSERSIKL